jgi:hypothetical protein
VVAWRQSKKTTRMSPFPLCHTSLLRLVGAFSGWLSQWPRQDSKSRVGSRKVLNSSAFPAGSRRKNVPCSPTCPANRILGGSRKSACSWVSRECNCSQSVQGNTIPKCRTGMASPSTSFVRATVHSSGRRCTDSWWPKKLKSIHFGAHRPSIHPNSIP